MHSSVLEKPQTSLTREQKEAVGLLSIGTFLEYFDLMLYVHMAVLLNELFFPKTDPFTQSLIAAFSFCLTFIFRPFGALLFGYIGDNIGRKATVMITTFLMASCCIIMATLPTYDSLGIYATIAFTLCRIAQGMSSMGEIIGAELFITETVPRPLVYPAVSFIAVFSSLGEMIALGVAALATMSVLSWRTAFFLGAIVALIGVAARTKLRETPEFVNAKKRINLIIKDTRQSIEIGSHKVFEKKINIKTLLSLFAVNCGWPPCLYYTYIYCGDILKHSFSYSPQDVIKQNFCVAIVQMLTWIFLSKLSYKIYPLKIIRVKLYLFCIVLPIITYLLSNTQTPYDVFMVQIIIVIFGVGITPAAPIYFKSIPIFYRFTTYAFIYALSRAVLYLITSFGSIYLVMYFGGYGILFIFIPITIAIFLAISHFNYIEKASGNHPGF
jgi:MFS family permease